MRRDYQREQGHAQPCLLPSGEVVMPREFYGVRPPANSSDPFDDEAATAAVNADGWTHAFQYSRSMAMVDGWQMTSPLGGPFEMLRRVDAGQEFGCNERWRVNANTGDEQQANPTYGGALLKPDSIGQYRLFPSPQSHQRIVRNGEEIAFEGACIPFDFDSYGAEEATNAWKGGDQNTPWLWHQMRQFQRFTANDAGRANVHRLEFASYFPFELSAANSSGTAGAQVIVSVLQSMWTTDWFAQGAWFWSPETRQTFQLHTTGDLNQWDVCDTVTFKADGLRATPIYSENGPGGAINYAAATSLIGQKGHVAAVLFSVPLNLFIAFVAKLHKTPEDCRLGTCLVMRQQRAAAHPAPARDTNSGQILSYGTVGSSSRAPGWIGHTCYIVTSQDLTDLEAKITALSRRGALDERFRWGLVPAHVMAGTSVPTG